MLIIDKYSYTNNLKDYSPIAKFYFAIGLMLLAMIIDIKELYISVFLLNFLIITVLAKISVKKYIKILSIPMLFLILGIVPVFISLSKDSNNFIFVVNIWDIYIGITEEGINSSQILLLRALSSVSCTFFLILTTPMNDLIYVLKKHKLPNIVIEMMVLIYRFIFILLDETINIIVAQKLKLGYMDIRKSYKSISALIASLFIRVMNRYESLQYSLDARGFDRQFYM
ncbi:cobalt ECF transporter T component CbiQ [Clostridium sp. D2Q-14]|uniref:cobalt ECF transporter T component CbiQ n=1 Tax=Anaeromonas gelatinilytica TaxID=2683194 RepID=UPI00193C1032|nr:cobalt ECF transporter T component CbiQ [Anaeromonas gelatinilytica]MBS4535472.1 cobalt ECF transporter T component CbiQ [Anaeromonas gelatinilytica]